jgi:hypothetical protein
VPLPTRRPSGNATSRWLVGVPLVPSSPPWASVGARRGDGRSGRLWSADAVVPGTEYPGHAFSSLVVADDPAAARREHEEAKVLYIAVETIGTQWRMLIELDTEVGLRPGDIRAAWQSGGLAQVADPGHRRDDPQRAAAVAEEQEVPLHRPCPGLHHGGHVGADDRPVGRRCRVHRAAGRPRGGRALPQPRLASRRGSCGHPAVPPADHAPHRGVLARAGRGPAV